MMSEKRTTKAGSRSSQPQPISLANPDPASKLERAEMTGNDREIEISSLTFRQQASLAAIAFAPTITQAARDSGVGESTLRRWLQVPDFRHQLDHFRSESADLARQQAQILLPRCLSVFAEAMDSPDLALRLRAARYAMSFAIEFSEVQTLKASLQELEEAIRTTNDASPPKSRG